MTNVRMHPSFYALVAEQNAERERKINARLRADRIIERERTMAQGRVYLSTERKLSARELRAAEKRDRREIRRAMNEIGM